MFINWKINQPLLIQSMANKILSNIIFAGCIPALVKALLLSAQATGEPITERLNKGIVPNKLFHFFIKLQLYLYRCL